MYMTTAPDSWSFPVGNMRQRLPDLTVSSDSTLRHIHHGNSAEEEVQHEERGHGLQHSGRANGGPAPMLLLDSMLSCTPFPHVFVSSSTLEWLQP